MYFEYILVFLQIYPNAIHLSIKLTYSLSSKHTMEIPLQSVENEHDSGATSPEFKCHLHHFPAV